jgi:hypothetical protein
MPPTLTEGKRCLGCNQPQPERMLCSGCNHYICEECELRPWLFIQPNGLHEPHEHLNSSRRD